MRSARRLAAQAELLDEGAIALEILALQVVQEAPAAPDELEQSTTGVVVVLVRAEVLGQLVAALGQHRDLDFGRAGVRLVLAELPDMLQLLFLGEGHLSPLVDVSPRVSARREGRTRAAGAGSASRVADLGGFDAFAGISAGDRALAGAGARGRDVRRRRAAPVPARLRRGRALPDRVGHEADDGVA